jgi:hypothetical protein
MQRDLYNTQLLHVVHTELHLRYTATQYGQVGIMNKNVTKEMKIKIIQK